MTAFKTLAVSVLAWGALGTLAHAAPMSWAGGSWQWSTWLPYQGINTSSYGPPAASYAGNAGANQNPWWNNPTYSASSNAVNNLSVMPQVTAVSAPVAAPVSPPPSQPVDAYINLGNGPYPESSTLTTGNAQPWYNSPSAIQAFGGVPDSQQQANFTQTVLKDVQQTFQLSGVNLTATTDPNVSALHTLSVVSSTGYGPNPNAIGITDVGNNGFSFIDKLSYAKSPDELAWAVAHNVSHELMHALGVDNHPDTTGTYLDSSSASWSMLTDPNTKFSPAAVQMMLSRNNGVLGTASGLGAELLAMDDHGTTGHGVSDAQVLAQPVPEPSTLAVWTLSALGTVAIFKRKARAQVA